MIRIKYIFKKKNALEKFVDGCFTLLLFTAGLFCSQPGLSQPTGLCEAGYHCPAGSTCANGSEYQVLFFSVALVCMLLVLIN